MGLALESIVQRHEDLRWLLSPENLASLSDARAMLEQAEGSLRGGLRS